MTHHDAFSTRVRNQNLVKVPGHGPSFPPAVHGKAEEGLRAKDKGYLHLHDSAFLAERGCLGGVNLPRRPAPGHQH